MARARAKRVYRSSRWRVSSFAAARRPGSSSKTQAESKSPQLKESFGFVAHALEGPSRGPCSNLDLSVASNAIDLPTRKPSGLPVATAKTPNVVVITAQ
jgi:hypothetical protein